MNWVRYRCCQEVINGDSVILRRYRISPVYHLLCILGFLLLGYTSCILIYSVQPIHNFTLQYLHKSNIYNTPHVTELLDFGVMWSGYFIGSGIFVIAMVFCNLFIWLDTQTDNVSDSDKMVYRVMALMYISWVIYANIFTFIFAMVIADNAAVICSIPLLSVLVTLILNFTITMLYGILVLIVKLPYLISELLSKIQQCGHRIRRLIEDDYASYVNNQILHV